jgi:hypothetical protein
MELTCSDAGRTIWIFVLWNKANNLRAERGASMKYMVQFFLSLQIDDTEQRSL